MKRLIISVLILFSLFSFPFYRCSITGSAEGNNSPSDSTGLILFNQVGYSPDAVKIALIRADVTNFEVIESSTGKTVFKGSTGKPEYWHFSGDTVRTADFSNIKTPGAYRLCLKGKKICTAEFKVGNKVYNDLVRASIKSFYYNRSGFEISQEYGSEWARKAGHPDTSVIVHPSAASKLRPAGTVISSPGGWYDAGDYNKYIVNSSITTYTMLLFRQLYHNYSDTLNVFIPESKNSIPDVVDELLYNLNWMLTMQDPSDGGVYHKLTNKEFGGFEMPDKSKEPRFVVQKSTAASLDFASVMAMASRVFATETNSELKALSDKCLKAALRAMVWAKENPDIIYKQPDDIKTGEYGDSRLNDELFWAKAEIALATKDNSWLKTADIDKIHAGTPSWNQVETLGLISLALSGDPLFSKEKTLASTLLTAFADTLYKKYTLSPYLVSLDYFRWGSNSDIANQAMLKLIALKLTGDQKYLPSIQGDVDYILGRNATTYCFVTGFGSKSPVHIHHRPSGSDKIIKPVPGFLVGGPNTNAMNDCGAQVKRSSFPARSYSDSECSYSTNEIAINWNAPLFFVIGAMDAKEK